MTPLSTARSLFAQDIPAPAWVLLVCLGLACLGTFGCGRPKEADTTAVQAPSPLNGTWVTKDLYAPDKSFDTLFPARPIVTLDLDQGLISGMSGCNQYMGKVSVTGQSIAVPGGLAVTKRACAKGMEGETIFLDLLQKANHWTMYNDGQLHLLINDMTVIWLERTR